MRLGWTAAWAVLALTVGLTWLPKLPNPTPTTAPRSQPSTPSQPVAEQARRGLLPSADSATNQVGFAEDDQQSGPDLTSDWGPIGAAVSPEPLEIGLPLDADDPLAAAEGRRDSSPLLPPELDAPLDADGVDASITTWSSQQPIVERGIDLNADDPSGWEQWSTDDAVDIGDFLDAGQPPS